MAAIQHLRRATQKRMATTLRSQATALEIPVTIQGSKIVPGTEQRELFTETTKTTLVFENGAVVKLTAKVAPGQCVFLRNEQSEKEVLCKVIEARQAGETGYTDLEFTSYDPKFWDAPAAKTAPPAKILTAQERLEAAANSPIASPVAEPNPPSAGEISEQPGDAGPKSETQKKIDEAVNNLSAPPSAEPIAPTSAEASFQAEQSAARAQTPQPQNKIDPAEWNPPVAPTVESIAPINAEIPSTLPESAPPPKSSGTLVASAAPIILESPHESLAHLPKHEPTDEELDWNPEKDAEMLAALATMSAGSKANREPAAKDTNPEAASAKPQEKNESASRAAADAQAKALTTAPSKTGKSRKFTSISKPVGIGIAAVLVLAAALGLFWRIRGGSFAHVNQPPVASTSSQPKQPAASVPAPGSQTSAPTTNANAGANNAAAAQNPSATLAVAGAAPSSIAAGAPPSKDVEDSPAVAAAKLAARGELSRADQEVLGIAHRKSNDKNADGNAPAKIVSQTAPALPDWAEGLEADRVVTLDALIDEKGNLVESKPLSGPRLLQQDAQRAVALWVFQPALSAGQPTSSHLRLTVEFQK
jgi:Gram-negative bacterial TonB protein C-terminal